MELSSFNCIQANTIQDTNPPKKKDEAAEAQKVESIVSNLRMSTKTFNAAILLEEMFAYMYVVYVFFQTVYYITEIIERWQISCYL